MSRVIRSIAMCAVAVLVLVLECSCMAGELGRVVIEGRVRLSENASISATRLPTNKANEVFGSSIAANDLIVDEKTRALADVFIWTDNRPTIANAARAQRYLALTSFGYFPRAQVLRSGDKLDFINLTTVADSISLDRGIAGHAGPSRDSQSISVDLGKVFDRPVHVSSDVYPFLNAWIFRERETSCATSNRAGGFRILAPPGKEVSVFMWHESLKSPVVESVQRFTSLIEPGRIKVAALKNVDIGIVTLNASDDQE